MFELETLVVKRGTVRARAALVGLVAAAVWGAGMGPAAAMGADPWGWSDSDRPLVSRTVTVPEDADISDMFAPVRVTALSPQAVAERAEALRVAELVEAGLWRWFDPVPVGTVTSRFGFRPAIEALDLPAGVHPGVDLAAPLGSDVLSAFAGEVTYVGQGYDEWGVTGWVVVVDHGVVDGHRVRTGYNHMAADGVLVQVGDRVDPGERIALVGNEGRSTGPHLHLTLEVDGQVVDPEPWFAERGVRF